jgi:hypothetical protein
VEDRRRSSVYTENTADSRKVHATGQAFGADLDQGYRQEFLVGPEFSFLPAFIDYRDHLAIFQVIVWRQLLESAQRQVIDLD